MTCPACVACVHCGRCAACGAVTYHGPAPPPVPRPEFVPGFLDPNYRPPPTRYEAAVTKAMLKMGFKPAEVSRRVSAATAGGPHPDEESFIAAALRA